MSPLLGVAFLAAAWIVTTRTPALHAQDPAPSAARPADAPPQDARPTFRAEANYVRVDVYPTVNGRAVPDLTIDDIEILEDGVPQRIDQFERVALSTQTAREERRDPTTVADAREQAADPRRRVLVVFLDTHHSTVEGSFRARRPLLHLLERLIGPDDLFAVMTPDMEPRAITFARRTESLDAALETYWTWGQRDGLLRTDPEERQLELCFPEDAPPRGCTGPGGSARQQPANAYQGVATQLIRRKRELEVLDALDGLVSYLGSLREERKAVITVTQGWQIFRPKPELTRLQECEAPRIPGIGTGPDGRIVTDTARARGGVFGAGMDTFDCHERATRYALLDNWIRFTALMERANRFNVSFYPFDTRGLAAWDRSMGDRDERIRDDPGEWPNRRDPRQTHPLADNEMERDGTVLRQRLESMQTLAANTDGLAIVNTNDLNAGAARIVDDLSTYYLLGYYSSNETLDGAWRRITARVRRPGVQVRARRGYRALRPEDMYVLDAPAEGADLAANAESAAVDTALSALAGANVTLPWRSHAAWSPVLQTDGGRSARLWVTAELDAATAREPGWKAGGRLTLSVTGAAGSDAIEREALLAPGTRVVSVVLGADEVPAGDLVIRLRLHAAELMLPLSDTFRVARPATSAAGAPRLLRAGQGMGPGFHPTADARFRRTERLRLEVPLADGASDVSAELLDRAGNVLTAIPVPATLRPADQDGPAWATATLGLAPLAQGDYVVRIAVTHGATVTRTLTAFKLVS
jgi:VWFA-related protein